MRRRGINLIFSMLVTSGVLWGVADVLAGVGNGMDSGFPGTFNRRSERSGAGQAAIDARQEVARKQWAFRRIGFTFENDLKQSNDWQVAVAEMQAARVKVNAIRQPLIMQVRETPEWRDTQLQIEALEKDLETKRDTNPSSPEITTLAKQLLDLRKANSAREQAALDTDDLQLAQESFVSAADILHEMWDRQMRTLKYNQDWRHAKNEVAAAQDKLINAQAAYDRERRQQANNDRNTIFDRVGQNNSRDDSGNQGFFRTKQN